MKSDYCAVQTSSPDCVNLKISIDDFAALLGTTTSELSPDCRSLIETFDSEYRILSGKEKDSVILEILKKIECPELTRAGSEKQDALAKRLGRQPQGICRSVVTRSPVWPLFF